MTDTVECSSCGTELAPHQIRCPVCGKSTAHYHRQRRCLHCGTPAAEKTKICMVCRRPVDSFPLSTSLFSGSWLGIGLGILIIVGIVMWVTRTQADFDQVAQVVETSTPMATFTVTPMPTPTSLPTATPTITPIPTPTPRIHIVESGDTLLYIAQRYGVILADLIELNDIQDVRGLSVGQPLIIPQNAEPVGGNNLLPPQMVYVIQEGDTLSDIAFEIGTPMEAILAANPDLNIDLIYVGQEIIVPLSTPTPTSTPTSLPTETPTPGPHYLLPDLLSPAAGQVVDESMALLNWTSTGLLADDEFYVVQLRWPDGATSEHWVQNSSWRISKDQHPIDGVVAWSVIIKRQTGTSAEGSPVGESLTPPGKTREFEWR